MTRIIFTFLCASLWLAGKTQPQVENQKPRLVVGIVVDQMRQEYLYRFANKFGTGGFKRLMGEGFMMRNAHYNYVPTYTGPGHASVYTGSTPAIHGIIANEWYDKNLRKMVNCVEDARYKPIGNDQGNGDVSPSRLLASTITDELKLFTQLEAKVVGISLKDRGAVLPAGHTPDGAYWYDGKSGKFISSTYYKEALPVWVDKFNAQNLADHYLSTEWKTVLPLDQYTESGPDDTPYESKFKGTAKAVFPYNLRELRKLNDNFEMITRTPFGDDLLTEMAKATIDGESLGKDDITDFLTVSFSSPDIVGHAFGPNSVEEEDLYIRLDRNIQDLLEQLDKKVGQGKYLVFLTADHAVADNPQYLKDNSFPADYFKLRDVKKGLDGFLGKHFPGKKVIDTITNDQVFLNQELFAGDPKTAGIDLLIATELITKYLLATPGVAQVYSSTALHQADYNEKGIKGMIVRGFNHKRSGDIAYALEPGWITFYSSTTGTTHGSSYTYDTNVPMLFYGTGIRKGVSVQYHPITDLAPTLSILLKIKFPNGCTGQPIAELLE
jgi:predicted AlkP superfamily pyrophosphatase or phosphodiesterase